MRQLLVISLVVILPLSLRAGEPTPISAPSQNDAGVRFNWSAEVLASNNVVWRGFLSNRTGTLQPSVTLDVGEFSVTSTSVIEFDGQSYWKEHDLLVSYSKPLSRRVSVTSGYTNYAYASLDKDRFAHEFFTGITIQGVTEASFQAFQDVGLSSGTYLSAGLSHSFRSRSRFPLESSTTIGFNRKLFIPVSTFSDAAVTFSTGIPLRTGITLTPQIGYSRGLNRRYFDSYLTAGVRLSYKREKSRSTR